MLIPKIYLKSLLVLCVLIAITCLSLPQLAPVSKVSAQEIEPTLFLVDGNPNCADLNADNTQFPSITSSYGFKLNDLPPNNTYPFTNPPGELTGGTPSDPNNSVTITQVADLLGEAFDWTSTIGISAVIVKGGNNANAYVYTPDAFSGNGLHAPVNPNNDKYFDISHIEFCYDYEPEVSKTAETSFTRTYSWTIDKTGPGTISNVGPNQPIVINGYSVAVNTTYVDSDWAVSGNISVENTHPVVVDEPSVGGMTINSVSDVIDGVGAASVVCGVTFPYTIPAGQTLNCTYSSALPNADTRTNTATAVWQNTPTTTKDYTGTASVDFAGATINSVDECVSVVDDKATPSTSDDANFGPFCANTMFDPGSISVTYSECGQHVVINTATFTTNDTGTTGSDPHSVIVEVTGCADTGGTCVRSAGYWRTHAKSLIQSSPPYDATWDEFRNSNYAGTPNNNFKPFYSSGKNYIEVMWTAPGGNAYYNLSFQYIAAQLNIEAGADQTPIAADMVRAAQIFNTSAPAHIGALKGNSALRKEILEIAGRLDRYNNGLLGPVYCNMSNTPNPPGA